MKELTEMEKSIKETMTQEIYNNDNIKTGRPKGGRILQGREEEIQKLFDLGLNKTVMAKLIGCNVKTLRSYIKEMIPKRIKDKGGNMTIRQISEVAGCSRDTVKRLVKNMYPLLKAEKRGVALELNKEQAILVMDKLPKKNYVQPSANAPSDIGQMTQVDNSMTVMMQFMKSMQEQQQEFMKTVLTEIKQPTHLAISEKSVLEFPPAPDIKPRALLRQLVNDYSASINISHRDAWNELYKQFYYRCNESIKTKSKNLKIIPIDYLEQENKLLTACSIMKELIG